MSQERKRRNRWPGGIYEVIKKGIAQQWTAAEIRDEFQRDPRTADLKLWPSLDAIRDIMRRLREDDAEPWSLGDASGLDRESARYVLDVTAAIITATEGRRRQVTRGEARWLQLIGKAAPDLDLWSSYLIAAELVRVEQGKTDGVLAESLAVLIAYAPWTDEVRAEAYERAVGEGWVPEAPTYFRFRPLVDELLAAGERGHISDVLGWVATQPDAMSRFERGGKK